MKYADLIGRMTLEEKCSLLSGGTNFDTKEIKRLGIPSMRLCDGPSGVRRQEGPSDQLGLHGSVKATCYPSPAAMANSWDEKLLEKLGAHLGAEAKAQRVNILLGPGLNIKRSPLCGRNFEYFSEDPFLSGKLAAAYISGVQSEGIAACPKHFAANSQEWQRMRVDSVLDERTLREIYLTGFEIAVREGRPKCLMSSYNRVNGVYANDSRKLLRDILKDEWGFCGFVVTDWGGSNDRVLGLLAGNHLEMPASQMISDIEVLQAVRSGVVSEELLDERIDEYLDVLFETRIPSDAPRTFDADANHEFARKAAEETIVLLKNEGAFLPLKKGARVAVIGDLALHPRYQGAGSSRVNPTRVDGMLDALKAAGVNVLGFAQGYCCDGSNDEKLINQAARLAKSADTALVFMGLTERFESEGLDRENMDLPENQLKLLNAVLQVNSNVVVVLCGGAPFETPWLDRVKAAVYGCLGGQAGAGAMADVLAGHVNPSGKLAETWPVCYLDTPNHAYYPGRENTAEYRESIYVGYRYYQKVHKAVRFPFGFGLSYTEFEYGALNASPKGVSFTVKNTGAYDGSEIAQVYVSKKDGVVFRAEQELKGFCRVTLTPGQQKEVTVPLDECAFRYFNVKTNNWAVESGEYEVRVGASAEDIRLSAIVTVDGTNAPAPYPMENFPHYASGLVTNVPDDEFARLLGHGIPPAKWDRNAPLGREDTLSQMQYAKRWYGRLAAKGLNLLLKRSIKKGTPDLNLLFQWNMPFRAIARMSGMLDMEMVDSLLLMLNGHFYRGLARFIGGFFRKKRAQKAFMQALEASARQKENGSALPTHAD